MTHKKDTILILGASGFLGGSIYKELCPYFKTYGTYNTDNTSLEANKHFFQYNIEEDDIFEILDITKPTVIISALRGNFSKQVLVHQHLAEYSYVNKVKFIFLSSANVFDAYSKFPSYELDTTLSHSIFGHFKIKVENTLLKLPKKYVSILRLPMVFGAKSPRIQAIQEALNDKTPIEVFPNLIMNVTTDSKVTQQIHYIINRNKSGVMHLGSNDLVHHNDFFKEIIDALKHKNTAILKKVYTTNDDRYLAVLSKFNKLPKHLQVESKYIIEELLH